MLLQTLHNATIIQVLMAGSKKCMYSEAVCIMVVQGYLWLIFVPIVSMYANTYK